MDWAPALVEKAGAADDPDRRAVGDLLEQVHVATAAVRGELGHGTDAHGGQVGQLGGHTVGHIRAVEVDLFGAPQHLPPVHRQVLMDERRAQGARRHIPRQRAHEPTHRVTYTLRDA